MRTTDGGTQWKAISLPASLGTPNLNAVDFHENPILALQTSMVECGRLLRVAKSAHPTGREKLLTYESGVDPVGSDWSGPFSTKIPRDPGPVVQGSGGCPGRSCRPRHCQRTRRTVRALTAEIKNRLEYSYPWRLP